MSFKSDVLGAEEMAQQVKCLPCKHEDQTLIPRTGTEKPSMAVHTCNPSAGEVEETGSPGLTG